MLRQLDTDLWVLEQPFSTGGLALGVRATIARLASGDLVVHSPVAPGPNPADTFAQVRALGDVKFLVAPNRLHYLFMKPWAEAFSQARVLSLASLKPKLEGLGVRVDALLDPPTQNAQITRGLFGPGLEAFAIEGMPKLDEFAFFHPTSQTLVLADLAFNIRNSTSFFTRLAMRMNGGLDRFGPTRFCRSMMKDKAKVAASIERLLNVRFNRVVVSHGDVVESAGHDEFARAFAFLKGSHPTSDLARGIG